MFIKVTSPYGNNLHHNENVTHGQFAFTTTEAGNYMACFWLGSNPQKVADATLGLDWRIGFSAKDWESVAKKDKIEASSLNYSFLLKLESGLRFLQISVWFLVFLFMSIRHASRVLSFTWRDLKRKCSPSMRICSSSSTGLPSFFLHFDYWQQTGILTYYN